jgi:hypothetical protein
MVADRSLYHVGGILDRARFERRIASEQLGLK